MVGSQWENSSHWLPASAAVSISMGAASTSTRAAPSANNGRSRATATTTKAMAIRPRIGPVVVNGTARNTAGTVIATTTTAQPRRGAASRLRPRPAASQPRPARPVHRAKTASRART